MKYNLKYYNLPDLKQTLKEIKKNAGKRSSNFCCVNPPQLEIELEHVVPDELHLLLRIMDNAVSWDQKEN